MTNYQYKTPLGLLYCSYNDQGFTRVRFPDEIELAKQNEYPALPQLYAKQLDRYFSGQQVDFNWPIDPKGTAFQKNVWQILSQIPHGKTITYKEIAQQLGTKGYQAVGSAVGANPLVIIIPCHRVVGVGIGNLGGYYYGVGMKRFLLDLENTIPQLDLC